MLPPVVTPVRVEKKREFVEQLHSWRRFVLEVGVLFAFIFQCNDVLRRYTGSVLPRADEISVDPGLCFQVVTRTLVSVETRFVGGTFIPYRICKSKVRFILRIFLCADKRGGLS